MLLTVFDQAPWRTARVAVGLVSQVVAERGRKGRGVGIDVRAAVVEYPVWSTVLSKYGVARLQELGWSFAHEICIGPAESGGKGCLVSYYRDVRQARRTPSVESAEVDSPGGGRRHEGRAGRHMSVIGG